MKVFWTDRDGNLPPKHAQFQCYPFFPFVKSPFPTQTQQIKKLPPPTSIKVLKRTFLPNKKDWIKIVTTCLKQKIEKIVLARCEILELEKTPNPFALTSALQQIIQNSYLFCFSNQKLSFLGASPERLFLRRNTMIWSEAIAATAPRGKTKEEDTRLGSKLLQCEKSLREILPVKNFLTIALHPLCISPPTFSQLMLHRTQNVQHLYTQCNAVLHEGISDDHIIRRIHPTPALCGTPKKKALEWIAKLEPFDRWLYGGVFGWKTFESSEWIVGIRSCCIQGKLACLYAGAGIVSGSDPEQEWEELNYKTSLFQSIFHS